MRKKDGAGCKPDQYEITSETFTSKKFKEVGGSKDKAFKKENSPMYCVVIDDMNLRVVEKTQT